MSKLPEEKVVKSKGAKKAAKKRSSPPPEEQVFADVVIGTEAEFCSYDENLLERSRNQWQFGDWESLAQLNRDTLQHHPDRAKLALLAAAGHLQQGDSSAARQFTRLSQEWGCSRKLVSQILVAGVYNSLGRAYAVAGQQPRAIKYFETAIQTGTPGSDARLLTQARVNQQYSGLGLLASRDAQPKHDPLPSLSSSLIDPEEVIDQALNVSPHNPALLIAGAELAMRQGRYDEAIRYWQLLAAVEGESMPKTYYDRLNLAYTEQKGFPPGKPEEEFLRGDADKHNLLSKIHALLNPKTYLEIGVQSGKSLALASCPSIGVDPMSQISVKLGANVKLARTTSDDFFATEASSLITTPPELVFIDGMHLFEYALRDFMNVERYSSPHTMVVIDDIFPGHPAQADRIRRTRAWTGDVWKLFVILERYRPDLTICALDAYPTGLLLITGLDSNNTVLRNSYDEILHIFSDVSLSSPPDDILLRKQAFSCKEGELESFINKLNSRKHQRIVLES